MADGQARISFQASRNLKLSAKEVLAKHGYDKLNEGFVRLLELGIEKMKTEEVKTNGI